MMLPSIFISIKSTFEAFNEILQSEGWDNAWGKAGLLLVGLSAWGIHSLLRKYFLKYRGLLVQIFLAIFFWLIASFSFICLFVYLVEALSIQFDWPYAMPQTLDAAIVLAIGWMLSNFIELIRLYFLQKYPKDHQIHERLERSNRLLKVLIYTSTLWRILTFLFFTTETLFLSGLSLFFGIFVLNNFRIYYDILLEKLLKEHYTLTYTLVRAFYNPLKSVIRIEIVYFTCRIVAAQLNISTETMSLIAKINSILLLSLMFWFFIRLIQVFEDQMLSGHFRKKRFDKNMVQATGRLLRIAITAVFLLFALPIVGVSISGILAFGGGSAIVLGIAVQPMLANYFGGIMIYSDRFFQEGDWVYSPDKSLEGTVEKIGWRSTLIRTFDKRPLYVPNGVFSSISVINASRMMNRRIKEMIGIRYSDASVLGQVTEQIRTMLQAHPEIDQKQTMLVHFTNFGPSSLNINVYTFTKTKDWKKYRDVQQDVFLKIIEIIQKNGAQLALPGRAVFIDKDDEGNFGRQS